MTTIRNAAADIGTRRKSPASPAGRRRLGAAVLSIAALAAAGALGTPMTTTTVPRPGSIS